MVFLGGEVIYHERGTPVFDEDVTASRRRGNKLDGLRSLTCTPTPESCLDCLICATFAQPRISDAMHLCSTSPSGYKYLSSYAKTILGDVRIWVDPRTEHLLSLRDLTINKTLRPTNPESINSKNLHENYYTFGACV